VAVAAANRTRTMRAPSRILAMGSSRNDPRFRRLRAGRGYVLPPVAGEGRRFRRPSVSTAIAGIGTGSDDPTRIDEQKLRNAVQPRVMRRFSERVDRPVVLRSE
jgi:hypothetical protein